MEPVLVPNGSNGGALASPPSTPSKRPVWDVTESIDYLPVTNALALSRQGQAPARRRWGYTGRQAVRLGTTLLSGLLIGFTAVVLELGIEAGVHWRNAVLEHVLLVAFPLAVARQVAISVAAAAATGAAVQFLAPGAAGAGVSLCMAFLNGNNISGLLTPIVYVVKLSGTVLSRSAALALGPEAPMVHLGACVASILCGLERKFWQASHSKGAGGQLGGPEAGGNEGTDHREPIFTNSDHREMVSAGAAAGMAAAFGAPIGGVLFAFEEACSVWSRKTAWRCLLCAAVATFSMTQLSPSGGGLLVLKGIYPLSTRQWLWQLPFVVLVSAMGALLGATFNVLRSQAQRLRAGRRRHFLRVLEAAGAAAVTVAVITALSSLAGRCLELPPSWDAAQVVRYSCPAGRYNDIATLLMGGSPWVIRSLLALGSASEPVNALCTLRLPCYYSPLSLALLCVSYLGLMVITAGLTIPGGLFMPSILMGSSFGALAGMVLSEVLPAAWDIQPGIYAIVGATATLGAVFRTSLALTVIVVEGTRGIELLVGILTAVIVSNFVAHWVHKEGIYESELERDGHVFFLKQEPPGALRWSSASAIMATPVVGFPSIVDAAQVVAVLRDTTHNGFPVHLAELPVPERGSAEARTPWEDGRRLQHLDGFILRSQLLVLLREQAFCDCHGQYLSPPLTAEGLDSRLEGLMQAASASSDGLGGASELGVDPLLIQMNSIALESELTFPLLEALPSASFAAPAAGHPAPGYHPADHRVYLNLEPFMNRAAMSVRAQTPATRVYQLFLALSLRHLCVVDGRNRVVGILTRKDLDHASGAGWWRTNRIAPTPHHRTGLGRSGSWLTLPLQRVLANLWQRVAPSNGNGNGGAAAQHRPAVRRAHSASEADIQSGSLLDAEPMLSRAVDTEEERPLPAFGSFMYH